MGSYGPPRFDVRVEVGDQVSASAADKNERNDAIFLDAIERPGRNSQIVGRLFLGY